MRRPRPPSPQYIEHCGLGGHSLRSTVLTHRISRGSHALCSIMTEDNIFERPHSTSVCLQAFLRVLTLMSTKTSRESRIHFLWRYHGRRLDVFSRSRTI